MTAEQTFLTDLAPRPWQPAGKHPLTPVGLYLGNGASAIEVAVASSGRAPGRGVMLETWKARRGGRAAPVLLIVLHPAGASVCGATGESPPVYPKVDREQAERLAGEVLAQPDRHAALRFLGQALPSLESALPGISNEGLVALHELQHGTRRRDDWSAAKRKAAAALGQRDRALVEALGFQMERLDNLTFLLRGANRRSALAVLLREDESPEAGADRFNSLSPISYALAKADDENLAWVVVVQGNRLRLYSTDLGAGVGRRGRTETYIECQPALLAEADLAYLWLLYSAEALARNGSLQAILDGSHRFAGSLASRLRERVYEDVVPALAHGIAKARNLPQPCPKPELDHTYEMALTVLFRLLFIAYAEDRDLLPFRFNDAYRRRSLKQKAQELAEHIRADTPIADGESHWHEVGLLWRAVADGNGEWAVPAYNGGLFSTDPAVSRIGADLAAISLANEDFETALRALLVIDTTEDVPGPVDFRSLGVREFGTIYEGLLESELAVADADLALDKRGTYVPAKPKDAVVVSAGEVYLHNRSGARKSSGSYYTKRFAVEYLLDGALEPALDDHFSRLGAMDDTDASKAFFDFRVVDIAMGSGHFLIAAIDRIEKRMADYLAGRSLPGVRNQLASLRNAATKSLGPLADAATIEDGQLLRRMIARRCTYGVDLNALSVQLARVSVWIHTFVPGLPLSVLDHTLVRGNALVGVGTVEEIRGKFAAVDDTHPLFATDADELLGAAAAPLGRLANVNDATLADIATAREAMQDAREAVRETEALCDLIAAVPLSNDEKVIGFPFEEWRRNNLWGGAPATSAREELDGLAALHFPIAFPEVFLRERPGFDVVLGNPPWQEATIEEHAFWARHFPGLRSLPQRQQEAEKERLREARPDLVQQYEAELSETSRIRDALVVDGFPGMGTGDPDLYKAFCWRFWHLTAAEGGRIGVVLPRSAVTTEFLKELSADDEAVFQDLLRERAHRMDAELFDVDALRRAVNRDRGILQRLAHEAMEIPPSRDPKLSALSDELVAIANQAAGEAINDEDERQKRKVLIFSFFEDTVAWIRDFLADEVRARPELAAYENRLAAVSGSGELADVSRHEAVAGFAPVSMEAPGGRDIYDLLLATDVLAEGVNLQQCRNIINFDVPWNPMRLVQRHGRIDRIGSTHDEVYLRTVFPADRLDNLLDLQQRIMDKLALAAASVGVVAPVQGARGGGQVFTETRDEIEKLLNQDATLYERGATASSAQTGEEYRQTLRKALDQNREGIVGLPRKIGSGMVKGTRRGAFFCAAVGDRTFLRFVHADANWRVADEGLVREDGTCLRLVECEQGTPRWFPDWLEDRIYDFWDVARQDILEDWMVEADPANVQPRVRPLNLRVAEFIRDNPPPGMEQARVERALDVLESPWPRREEVMLRRWFESEERTGAAAARYVVEQVLETGLEPAATPEPRPPIMEEDIELVCWMGIDAETE